MEREEAVKRCIADHEIATDPDGQRLANQRNGGKQVNNDLRPPEGHLPPGQQVAHEGLGHQHQENQHTENPDQLARLAVRTVEQTTEHVQIDYDEEG